MGTIRKQTILSSVLIYIGFLIGAINVYLYTKKGFFTTEEFALTRLFFDIGQNFYIFSSLGLIPILQKFFPYYKDHLTKKENDIFTWVLLLSIISFCIIAFAGYLAEPLVIRKFTERSKLVVDYYYYIIFFAFGMLLFSVFEGLSWSLLKTIMPNFLKETGLRIVTLLFIILFCLHIINYHTFIILFSTLFYIIAIAIVIYLFSIGELHLTFKISRVTKKFFKKMLQMQTLIFSGLIIIGLGQTMDGIYIASLKGLGFAGVYTLAQYAANFIQVPQRSLQSIVTGILSHAWKDKNYAEINRIYQRSCINMLLMSLFIFGIIILNIKELFVVLQVKDDFNAAISLFIILGLVRIIDAGTGVNNIIIGTSTFWKFDFITGIVLLGIRLPLSYIFIKKFGTIGAAYSELIGITVYNFLRWNFLNRKFNMQPFTSKTVISIACFAAIFMTTYFSCNALTGWLSIIVKSLCLTVLFVTAIFMFKLTPDAIQLYDKIKKKF